MRKKRLYDSERYEVLAAVYGKDGTDVRHGDVGAYRTKTVRAGEFLYVSCYPLISMGAKKEQDARLQDLKQVKNGRAIAKYARYNNSRRMRAFEQLVHANFPKGSWHLTCTYAPPEYGTKPAEEDFRTREEAKKDIANFIRRVKRLMIRYGCDAKEFRWISVTVTVEHDREAREPFPDTHHHHLLFHGVPEELRGAVERLWKFGVCNADRVQPDDKGIANIANYLARQEGRANGVHRLGEKSYSSSKNLKKPEVRTSDSRISRRRAALIAADVRANGSEVFGKVYPDYRLVEPPKVMISDFTAGAYIWAKLRIRETKRNCGRKVQRGA